MKEPFDVTGLGLTRAQGAVLAGIGEQGVSTGVHLGGRLQLSAEAVSRAVSALVDMGLIDRGLGRPRPLMLSSQLDDGLQRLRLDLVEQQRRQRAVFDEAAKALLAARDAAQDGPAPLTGLVPSQPVTPRMARDLFPMRETWEEILARTSPVFGSRQWLLHAKDLGISARLLVVGELPRPSVVRGVIAHLGHELRVTTADLPQLLIVDRKRARIELMARNARRHGWTEDPRHLALAAEAFETAWAQAEPAVVVPARKRRYGLYP